MAPCAAQGPEVTGPSHQQPHKWDEDCVSDSARFTAEVNLNFTTLSVHETTGQLWTLWSLHMVKPDKETYYISNTTTLID